MESSIAASATSSTVAESCLSSQASSQASKSSTNIRLLEISLISAEDLASVSKSMQTYAVAWINPNKKRTTLTDSHGKQNPEWTEKFIFRLSNDQMENATFTTEIYTTSWFRDVLVGSVGVPLTELLTPLLQTSQKMNFVTLQIRRPNGAAQGKLNMAVALLDNSMRSATMKSQANSKLETNLPPQNVESQEEDIEAKKLKEKIHLWRSTSTGSSTLTNDEQFASNESGSVICSDIGPSASMIAGEGVLRRVQHPGDDGDETASSIIEVMTIEEAKARGYTVVAKERGKKGESDIEDESSSDLSTESRRSARRRSDGGLFSCMAFGTEITVVCGGSSKVGSSKRSVSKRSRRKVPSEVNSA